MLPNMSLIKGPKLKSLLDSLTVKSKSIAEHIQEVMYVGYWYSIKDLIELLECRGFTEDQVRTAIDGLNRVDKWFDTIKFRDRTVSNAPMYKYFKIKENTADYKIARVGRFTYPRNPPITEPIEMARIQLNVSTRVSDLTRKIEGRYSRTLKCR